MHGGYVLMKDFLQRFKNRLKNYWSWENLNPLNWSNQEIKLFLGAFFAIMLPIYIFIGLQPIPTANADSLPHLEIPSISLNTPVASLELTDHQLIAPETIAGVYKSAENKLFIIGHSSTVFKKLDRVKVGETFTYEGKTYQVQELKTLLKSDISMTEILQAEGQETIIIMTCAGSPLPNQDATHRLIVTATLASE